MIQPALGPRPGDRYDVIVLGAGMAGLVAAYELKRAGHHVTVLEAQQRAGGRVYTLRTFAPSLYAEAGAMRIPRAHDLTMGYCEHFGLPLRRFVTGNPRGLVHVGGVRMTLEQAEVNPAALGFSVADGERGRTADALWETAIADFRQMVDRDGDAAWETIVRDNDQYSLYEFLRYRGWSAGAIEYFGIMNFYESDLHNAFVEVLREELSGVYTDMLEVEGGMDLLPNAFLRELDPEVRFGAEVQAIDQDAESVTVHYRSGAGSYSARGHFAICTIPFSVLRSIEMLQPLSRAKQRAIRQLNYHASTKILVQVRERLWETEAGILGGATVTDLSVRRINYPTPDPATRRGVLLASYTWGQDALRWGAMDPRTRQEQALDDLEQIHPGIREVYEGGDSHSWYGDRWAGGAFALFAPEQQTDMHADIVSPEGRILFAGEHCSLYHAWIQGALESGLRAARQVHESGGAPGAAR
jgi:monoamine oxidase